MVRSTSPEPASPAQPAGDGKRWARRKEARPSEIIAAALDLFVEKGYANTRGEDVAARAGISKGTLYLYFANKEELFKAVVRENIVPTLTEGKDLVERFEGSTFDLLRQLLRTWWEKVGATKASGITKLMMAESCNFPEIFSFYYDEVIAPSDRLMRSALQRGVDRGEFRDIDVPGVVHCMVAPVLLLMMWQHSGSPCDFRIREIGIPRHLDALMDLIAHGLAQPGAAAAAPATAPGKSA